MSTIGKIAVIIALIAGLASLGLTFAIKPKQDKLRADLVSKSQELQSTQNNLASTRKDLETTKSTLDQTKNDLTTTKSDLEAAKTARTEAETKATQAETKTKELADQVTAKDQQIAKIQEDNKAALASVPELKGKVDELKQQVTAIEAEKQTLGDKVKQQEQQIAELEGAGGKVALPAGLRGKVLVYEKNWNFVVIDIGRSSGAVQNGELDVYRNTKFIGKVKLTAVNTHLAIANVLPQWSKLEIKEGDMVMPAS